MAVKKTDPEDMVPVPAEQVEAREPKEKRTTTKKSDGKAAGFCVYLGPSIRGVIQSGTVYRGVGPGTEAALVLIKTDEGWSVMNWAEIRS